MYMVGVRAAAAEREGEGSRFSIYTCVQTPSGFPHWTFEYLDIKHVHCEGGRFVQGKLKKLALSLQISNKVNAVIPHE